MRKLLPCLFLLLFAACASDEVPVENLTQEKTSTNLRTVEEAIEISKNMFAVRYPSRAAVDVADVAVIGTSSSRSTSDTLIYAVNFADNQGFTLVSASKYGKAVIGYTDDGVFNSEDAAQNPGFSYYLGVAKNYVASTLSDGGLYPGLPINPTVPEHRFETIAPRVTVNWGQRYPEGVLCPNKIAGCAQTASAMILSYIKKPVNIVYECGEFGVTSENLNWDLINTHVTSLNSQNSTNIANHLTHCGATESVHNVLSRICREIGYRSEATYNATSTSTNISKALNTLKSLLPANNVTDYISFSSPYSALYQELRSHGCVALVVGQSSEGGHGWVCDGGEDYMTVYNQFLIGGELEERIEHDYYYHYNWGWCGNSNGYFSAGVFEVEVSSGSYNFNQSTAYSIIYK